MNIEEAIEFSKLTFKQDEDPIRVEELICKCYGKPFHVIMYNVSKFVTYGTDMILCDEYWNGFYSGLLCASVSDQALEINK